MKKLLLIGCLFLSWNSLSLAQKLEYHDRDSIGVYPRRARLMVWSVNILINRYDAHINGGGRDFARVTPSSWWENIKTGVVTDWNSFTVNWFLHPFHGSMLFNAGRTNGRSFWGSTGYALGGTLIWEYLGEKHPASDIDIVNTTLGGIYLGEMLFRLSEQILDDRAVGKNRIFRESAAGILNPVGLANRLIFGEARRVRPYRNHAQSPVTAQFMFGTNFPFSTIRKNKFSSGPVIDLTLTYNNPFKIKKKVFEPFDFFILRSWFNFPQDSTKSKILLNISSHATVWGKRIRQEKNKTDIIGISQHYDYLHNKIMEVGAMSISGGWLGRRNWKESWSFIGSTQAGIILLGSSNSELIKIIETSNDPYKKRDYIIGPGFMTEFEFILRHKKFGYLMADYNHWSFYVTSVPKGDENVDLLRLRYFLPVWKKFTLGIEYSYYHRLARFEGIDGYEYFIDHHSELKAMIGWRF